MLPAAFICLTSLGFLLLSASAGQQADPYKLAVRFSVTDTSAFTFDLGRDLIVKATRAVNADGTHFGWDLAVHDRRLPNSPNFFYDCLCGHGPRPNDLYAWHFKHPTDYPAERTFPVYGYPYTVRVECEKCDVAGVDDTSARFVSGTVLISWRRLPESNPRQLRLADLIKRRKSGVRSSDP